MGVECSTKEGNTKLSPLNCISKEAALRWSRNYSFFCRNRRFITCSQGPIIELVFFHINPAHSFPPKICKFQLSTMFPSICWSPKWSLLFRSSDQNCVQISQSSHSCSMSYPAHILVFHHPNYNGRVVQIMDLPRQWLVLFQILFCGWMLRIQCWLLDSLCAVTDISCQKCGIVCSYTALWVHILQR